MLKCVIFDLGDTLIGNSKGVKKTVQEKVEIKELKKAGFSVTEKEYSAAFGKMNQELAKVPGQKKYSENLPAYLIIKHLGIKPSWKLAERLAKNFFETQKTHTKMEPHAIEVLQFLKKNGFVIGLISNAATGKAKKWLKIFNLPRFFDVILISEDMGFDKSELVPFKLFLEKVNKNCKEKILASECLMVGNDAVEDISAHSLGMKVALYLPGLAKKEKQKNNPDFELTDLREIKKIVFLK